MTSLSRSQAAWSEFADSLKRIGEKITAPTGARGGRERAEGYRYLLRLISAAHDLEMESDRRFPELRRMMTPIRKFKGDATRACRSGSRPASPHGRACPFRRHH